MSGALTFEEFAEDLLLQAGLDLTVSEQLAVKLAAEAERKRPEFLTKSDLMIRWQCSERSVRRWVRTMRLRPMTPDCSGGRGVVIRYRAKDVAKAEAKMATPVHVSDF